MRRGPFAICGEILIVAGGLLMHSYKKYQHVQNLTQVTNILGKGRLNN